MGHGNVADEIKGRGPPAERDGRDPGDRRRTGCGFAPTLDGSERLLRPGDLDGGPGGARTRTSRWCSTSARRSTSPVTTPPAPPSARTAGWSAACDWHAEHGPADQLVYGIVQGGVEPDLRRESAQTVAASAAPGVAVGGTPRRRQAADVRGRRLGDRRSSSATRPDKPRHLLGIGEVDDLIAGVERGIDTFDCAMPTRLARHGVAAGARSRAPLAARPDPGGPRAGTRSRSSTAVPARPVPAGLHAAPTCTTCCEVGELTGAAADHPAQPELHRRRDGRPPRRDRRPGELDRRSADGAAGAARAPRRGYFVFCAISCLSWLIARVERRWPAT